MQRPDNRCAAVKYGCLLLQLKTREYEEVYHGEPGCHQYILREGGYFGNRALPAP